MESKVGITQMRLSVPRFLHHIGRCEEFESGMGAGVVAVDILLRIIARRGRYVVKDKPGHGGVISD